MSRMQEFALVLGPEELSNIRGTCRWAVCRVRDDGAETGFFEDRASALAFAAPLPVVPSAPGHPSVTVPYEQEVEIVSMLLDALPVVPIDQEGVGPSHMPEGFTEVAPASFGGLSVVTGDHGLEFALDEGVVKALGWEGRRIGLGMNATGTRLALCASASGPRLVQTPEGPFEAEHAVPYPLELVGTPRGIRLEPPYEMRPDGIVLEVSCLGRDVPGLIDGSPRGEEKEPLPERDTSNLTSVLLGALLATAMILLCA